MRILLVVVLLGACAFERGYAPQAGDDGQGQGQGAGNGEDSGGGVPPPAARTCQVTDPELRLCIEMDNRVFTPMVTDSGPGALDATTQQVAEAARGSGFAAELGDGARIQIPESDLLDPLSGLTIEMWIRPAYPRPAALLTNVGQYFVQVTGTGQIGCGVPGALVYSQLDDAVAPQDWTHIACTFDNATLAVYVDGQLSASDRINLGYLSDAGTTGTVVGGGFIGRLDDLRIYGRTLGTSELCAHAGDACD